MNRDTRELEEYLERNASKLTRASEGVAGAVYAARQDMVKRKARATRLQGLRKKSLRLTQKDLAMAVGANVRTLQSWERGRQDYPNSVEILMKLMRDVPVVRRKLLRNAK